MHASRTIAAVAGPIHRTRAQIVDILAVRISKNCSKKKGKNTHAQFAEPFISSIIVD